LLNTDVENILTKTVYAELITFKHGCWGYITYIFKDLTSGEYISCTRFPHWDCPDLDIGDKGFLKFREVHAGTSKWYNKDTGTFIPYKYTGVHFLDFVYEKPKKDIIM